MKKFQIIFGLMIMVFAMLAVATPNTADAQSKIGGWIWSLDCCWGNGPDNCYYAAAPAVCYYYTSINLAYAGTGGTTIHNQIYPCTGNYYCNTANDTDCSAGPNY